MVDPDPTDEQALAIVHDAVQQIRAVQAHRDRQLAHLAAAQPPSMTHIARRSTLTIATASTIEAYVAQAQQRLGVLLRGLENAGNQR